MRIPVSLVCPYCGTLFEVRPIIDAATQYDGIMQICPDDEFEGACGNVFYYDIELMARAKRYFAAPDVQQSLQASADNRMNKWR